ncbi:MAG: glycosyltransferase family 1 protein [Deltaproteobacteria bacterium]|nr:MAG: glycosyltransferase family 1 protein [Deltaproteobacteria bacterium]
MNIGILSSTYLPTVGGIQFLLYWLLKAMDRSSLRRTVGEIYAIVPASISDQEYADFENIKVIEYHRSLWSIKGMLAFIPQLAAIGKDRSLDLLHAFTTLPEGVCCLGTRFMTGIPYLVTCHGEDIAMDPRFGYGNRLKKTIAGLTRAALKGSAGITTISTDMARFAKNAGAPPTRIHIIPNGIELNGSVADAEVGGLVQELRWQYGITETHTVYLTLAGMRKIKGHEPLVRSFAAALQVNPNLLLFIGAHGLETEPIKKLVRALHIEDKVHFIGFVTGVEKKAWFNLADVYCNTAFFEPFGLVYLEAILYRDAVLGSIFGGGKDIFRHQENAWLVNPENDEEIVQGLLTLAEPAYRLKLVEAAQPLLPHYDINAIAGQYLELYRNIISK